MRIIRESIVVRANAHNPSILNPLFLKSEGIVPEDWEMTGDSPICTPPFSVVKFKNGVVFLVDSETLQVSQSPDNDNPSEFGVPQCVKKYIKVLPHVPYTALGINFDASVDHEGPEKFLIKKFLQPGKWNDENQPLKALSLKLVYVKEKWILALSLEPLSGLEVKEFSKGISVSGNYHLNLSGNDRLQKMIDAIGEFYGQRNHFKQLVDSILSYRKSEW